MKNVLQRCIAVVLCLAPMVHASGGQHSKIRNPCQYIPGHWDGNALIIHWLIGKCRYRTYWESATLGSSENFILKMMVDKNSGGIFCPRHGKKKLRGTCVNGAITIITKHGNLKGTLFKNAGEAQGTIYLIPGVGARISVAFERQGY